MQATKSKTNKELLIIKSDNSLEEKMESNQEASKKPRRNLEALSSNTIVTPKIELYKNVNNSEYINTEREQKKEEQKKEKENIPKKPKRNFDALEVSEKPKINFNTVEVSTKPKRNFDALEVSEKPKKNYDRNLESLDISGLDEEIYNLERSLPTNNKPRRDLSKLEEDINDTKQKEQIRKERYEKKKERYQNRNDNEYNSYDNIEQKKQENLKLNININDSELFPSLALSPTISTPTLLKNNSKWNIKSELVSSPINLNSPFTPKSTPTPVRESFKISKNYHKNISSEQLNSPFENELYIEELYDSDGNIVEEIEVGYNNTDEYLDDAENDSNEIYIRELYRDKDILEDLIEFVEETYDPRKKEHVDYLTNLQFNLANIDDKIDKHIHLERELEAIYGPSYIKYKSLYDIACEKREEEEQKIKSNDPVNIKKFYDMLNQYDKKKSK
jgi:hypothetical protein